jgi:hypothetical protein
MNPGEKLQTFKGSNPKEIPNSNWCEGRAGIGAFGFQVFWRL